MKTFIGTIRDKDLKKKTRKKLPPPSFRMESKKTYRRDKFISED